MRYPTVGAFAIGLFATAVFAADIPTNIGGSDIPASRTRGLLENLGFTDLDSTPKQEGRLLFTSGKWEGRDVELEINLDTGVIRVLKEGQ